MFRKPTCHMTSAIRRIDMTGVSILAIEEVAIDFAFNWNAFLISVIIITFFCIIILVDSWINEGFKALIAVIIMSILVGCLAGAAIGSLCEKPIEYENIYKVTITDEVSMTDFMDKYEVIEQEGKIYTVRERN